MDERNIKNKFNQLLLCNNEKRCILSINKEYKNYMTAIFWNLIIRYYNKVEFVKLDDDILYQITYLDCKEGDI